MRPRAPAPAMRLRTHLRLHSAVVALSATIIVTALQLTFASRHMRSDLRERAAVYCRLLQQQLSSAVAFDDHATAREVLHSFAADDEVDGVAVYDERGHRIEGHGQTPAQLDRDGSFAPPPGEHVISVGTISTREGPGGRVVVSLSVEQLEAEIARRAAISAVTAAAAITVAMVLAQGVSHRLTGRLAEIADGAGRIAAGDFLQPELPASTRDEIGTLARAFNQMVAEVRRLFDERRDRAASEQARLATLVALRTKELEESREQYRLIAETTNAIPFALDLATGAFPYVGPQAERVLGYAEARWREPGFLEVLLPRERAAAARKLLDDCRDGSFELECRAVAADGRACELRWTVSARADGGLRELRGFMLDVTARRRLEAELFQSQKLESVGRLAAGVAHEINTPIQFVTDSVTFVRDSMQPLCEVVGDLVALRHAVGATPADPGALAQAAAAAAQKEEEVDLPYLVDNVPKALGRSLEGLERVTAIVRSMKEFAHPDGREMTPVDLNHAIESTLVIARNEYKYVADAVTELGEIPHVLCHVGEVNQAVLNLVVNAAHAIGDVVRGTDRRGRITVRTRRDGDAVVIEVADTGTGIPEAVRDRVFEPFFTTKEVGRGTGQGLAMARAVIVDKHGGDLSFESTVGVGTTFTIRLPLEPATAATTEPMT